jgi:hypothetical protein
MGQLVEKRASMSVLGIAPGFHLGIVPVFQPTIIIHDLYSVVDVRDGPFRSRRRHGRCRVDNQKANNEN